MITITVPVKGRLGKIAAICAATSAIVGALITIVSLFALRDSVLHVDLRSLPRTGIAASVGSSFDGMLIIATDRFIERQQGPLFLGCGNPAAMTVNGLEKRTLAGRPECVGFVGQAALLPGTTFGTKGFNGGRLVSGSLTTMDATRMVGWVRLIGASFYLAVGVAFLALCSKCADLTIKDEDAEAGLAMIPLVLTCGALFWWGVSGHVKVPMGAWHHLGLFAGCVLVAGFVAYPLTSWMMFALAPAKLVMRTYFPRATPSLFYWLGIPIGMVAIPTLFYLSVFLLFSIMRFVVWALFPSWLFSVYELSTSGL